MSRPGYHVSRSMRARCHVEQKLIGEIAKVTADEAKALGYTNIYSPILDIAQDPRWGRVVESYGEDPYLVGELGKQMILGLQNEGIVATPKHLPFTVFRLVDVTEVRVRIRTWLRVR